MLAALGREFDEAESEAEMERAYVGAVLIANGLHELTLIRKLLTAPEKK